ncbi:MBL fold metallo-hydrolase [Halorubrum vacuolatum]|uniref:Phosphoribosyl 1,2-cyclic phosphate phosphodiesterase n=1 Tax=Halorubrum vacuolatum TaxID=63740 RepID=A0A238VVB0_HALVU|nr:MBL fold metallo-hydrolase [Halorubrum vacuolatum]SNR37763.1 phosphoribosyl 1,2-cyclic phosphate phosphodiesterase [Halorubrum vacuolatum]
MRVTLLGTGDTTGTPTVGCDCGTCRTARDRGISRSRFSVHVYNERLEESLLIDFSPDFRSQFLAADVPLPDEGIVTHIHFDHLDGLGNLYRLVDGVPIHAPAEVDPATDESVADTIRSKYDYLEDRIGVHARPAFEPFEACGLTVRFVPVTHPPLLGYGVVIEDPETDAKLSITGDTSYGISEESREALSDPDLLLADAIVPASVCEYHPIGGRHEGPNGVPRTFGSKHMTREGALALAEELNAARTRLVHIAHYYPAEEAFAEPLAVDGEAYEL